MNILLAAHQGDIDTVRQLLSAALAPICSEPGFAVQKRQAI